MIRIPRDPLLESRLIQSIHGRLRRRTPAAQYPELWEVALNHNLRGLRRWTFWLLHRQFQGSSVPGLREAVRVGRLCLGWLKGRA